MVYIVVQRDFFFKGEGARHYVSPTNGGGERLKDVNCVAVKFI